MSYPQSTKPFRWTVRPHLVSPHWRWFWRDMLVHLPLWEGGGSGNPPPVALSEHGPIRTTFEWRDAGNPVWVPTPRGIGLYFERARSGRVRIEHADLPVGFPGKSAEPFTLLFFLNWHTAPVSGQAANTCLKVASNGAGSYFLWGNNNLTLSSQVGGVTLDGSSTFQVGRDELQGLSWDGSTIRLIVNGRYDPTTQSDSTIPDNTNFLTIGSQPHSANQTTRGFDGHMYAFYSLKGAISEDRLAQLSQDPLGPFRIADESGAVYAQTGTGGVTVNAAVGVINIAGQKAAISVSVIEASVGIINISGPSASISNGADALVSSPVIQRVKPYRWAMAPGLVDSRWRRLWSYMSFMLPVWDIGYVDVVSKRLPEVIAGNPTLRVAEPGPVLFFDKTANGNLGEALNYGRDGPKFPVATPWCAITLFRTFGTSHDDQGIFGYTEAGDFGNTDNHLMFRIDDGVAPVNIDVYHSGASVISTPDHVEVNQWYVFALSWDGTTLRIRTYLWPSGLLVNDSSATNFTGKTGPDTAFCIGRTDGSISGESPGDEVDGEFACFYYIEGTDVPVAEQDRLASDIFGPLQIPSAVAVQEAPPGPVTVNANVGVISITGNRATVPSIEITGISFNWATLNALAPGSDNWSMTWASNGHQYTVFGDGGGFGGTNSNGRVGLGFARVEGDKDTYTGHNINGGLNPESGNSDLDTLSNTGKSYALIALDGTMYVFHGPGSLEETWDLSRLAKSTNLGETWADVVDPDTSNPVEWTDVADGIGFPFIFQFGQNNSAGDGYVYVGWHNKYQDTWTVQSPGEICLSRVLEADIERKGQYEWWDGAGWSSNVADREPIIDEPTFGVGPVSSGIYLPALNRYVLIAQHTNTSSSEAVWYQSADITGPYTVIERYTDWGTGELTQDSTFYWNISPKWLSNGDTDFVLVFTGIGDYDSWNTVEGSFTTAGPVVIQAATGTINLAGQQATISAPIVVQAASGILTLSGQAATITALTDFPSLPILDDFNRADGALGANWTVRQGGPEIVSNQMGTDPEAITGEHRAAWNTVTSADSEVYVTLSTLPGTGNHFRLFIRRNDETSNAYALYWAGSGTTVELERFDNGVDTTIDTATLTVTAGTKFGIRAEGTTITAYADTGSGWQQIAQAIDATHQDNGEIQVLFENITARLDDFGGGSLATPPVIVQASPGILSISGQSATVSAPVTISSQVGILTLAGQQAVISTVTTIQAQVAVLALSGQTATLDTPLVISVSTGLVQIQGQQVTIVTTTTIQVSVGVLLLQGQQASITAGAAIDAGAGIINVQGQAATITTGAISIQSGPGVLSISGQQAAIAQGETTIQASPALVAIIGQSATIATSFTVAANTATVDIQGQTATLVAGATTITCAVANISINGPVAAVAAGSTVLAHRGSIALSGQQSTIVTGAISISAGAGLVQIQGQASALVLSRTIAAQAGVVLISGQATTLVTPRAIESTPGVISIAGQAATLATPRTIEGGTGVIAISGQQAFVTTGTAIQVAVGLVDISGQQATVTTGARAIAAGTGSILLAGQQAAIAAGTTIAATVGVISITGQQTTITANVIVAAQTGNIVIAGDQASIQAGETTVSAAAGIITIDGLSATIDIPVSVAANIGLISLDGQTSTVSTGAFAVEAGAGIITIVGNRAFIDYGQALFDRGTFKGMFSGTFKGQG